MTHIPVFLPSMDTEAKAERHGIKTIVVLGAAGIIGQTMRLCQPSGWYSLWVRSKADCLHIGLNLENPEELNWLAEGSFRPDVVVNLAGENRPDVVERDPGRYHDINVGLPARLVALCDQIGAHLIQVSSQAVFGGLVRNVPAFINSKMGPPYSDDSPRIPVNQYGAQKLAAEQAVSTGKNWTIFRPTFVLGVRPMPAIGRENPVEQMLNPVQAIAESETHATMRQVNDRWFSVCFARTIARIIWLSADGGPSRKAFNVGVQYRTNRHILASYLRPDLNVEPVSHDSFEGLAPRPADTTYGPIHHDGWRWISDRLEDCKSEYSQRMDMTIEQRAREIAIFLAQDYGHCLERLKRGFGPNHNAVSDDWRAGNPATDEEILSWYRETEAYIWELTAYHLDAGFNYTGTVHGVCEGLRAKGVRSVLCLGDGVGDLTMELRLNGFWATYHDLNSSRTARFAEARFLMRGVAWASQMTDGWDPISAEQEYDAIVSLDFLEHVVNVEEWVRAIFGALKPGGWLMAQNAFACGSGPDGAMPMHLARNDRFEKDWDPLLARVGFVQVSSNWYRKP